MMDKALNELDNLTSYFGDVVIDSDTWDEHLEHLEYIQGVLE